MSAALPLGQHVTHAARRHGGREALVFGERRWTFGAFADDVERTARALLALGLTPGARVALWMPNRPEWLHVFYAAATVGLVVVPLNTRWRGAEAEHVLRQSGAAAVVATDRFGRIAYSAILRELCPELQAPAPLRPGRLPALRHAVVLGDDVPAAALSWAAFLDGAGRVAPGALAQREQAVGADTPVLILYTSGTTGAPRGALHDHRMARTVLDGASRLGITPRDTILISLPLFHSMGLYEGGLLFLLTGARGVVLERFEPGEALELIARERVTYVCGFDTHFQDLLEHPRFAATDVRSVRLAFLPAGLASTEPVARRVNRAWCRTVSAYGSTEVGTGACLSFLDASEDERCRGSGFPLPGYELRTVHPETGQDVAGGEPGEILVRGYGVTRGYHRPGGGVEAVVDADGWFHTGDMGVLDGDGFLRLIGRYKDMLKVGGENVDPLEVEAYLLGHPGVAQVKVVGVPDRRLGEVVAACVVPKAEGAVTADDVIAFCRGRIAGFKVPRHVLFVRDYPMTASGKVQRFALRDRVREALGPDVP